MDGEKKGAEEGGGCEEPGGPRAPPGRWARVLAMLLEGVCAVVLAVATAAAVVFLGHHLVRWTGYRGPGMFGELGALVLFAFWLWWPAVLGTAALFRWLDPYRRTLRRMGAAGDGATDPDPGGGAPLERPLPFGLTAYELVVLPPSLYLLGGALF